MIGGRVSESGRGKSDTEIVAEVFAERIAELHPNIDREELYQAVINTVNEMAATAAEEEEGDEEEVEG